MHLDLGGVGSVEAQDRRVEAEALLDGNGIEVGPLPQLLVELGPLEQPPEQVRDQRGRGLVATHQQLIEHDETLAVLEATAVDSFKYLVVTRMVACVIAVPLLTTLMNFTGIVGGWIAEVAISGMSFEAYFRSAFSLIGFTDYIPATLKTMVFGFLIAVTASYLGVNTSRGTEGVGQAATRSVVAASILLIASNVVLVQLIFFLFPDFSE